MKELEGKVKTENAEVETSGFVEVITSVLPFILLVIIAITIFAIVYLVKLVKQHKTTGQQLRKLETELQEIRQQLDRIEKS